MSHRRRQCTDVGARDLGLDPQLQAVVEGLCGEGYVVLPDFLPSAQVSALRDELLAHDAADGLKPAGVGRNPKLHDRQGERRDRIRWLDGSSVAQRDYLDRLEALRLAINGALFLGLFDVENHFALYEAGGFYRRHRDAFSHHNPRVVSCVTYLNDGWQEADGGHLKLWHSPLSQVPVAQVLPEGGTLVCFLSEQVPHEVMPATRTRLSLAGWFRRNPSNGLCIDTST